MLPGYNHNVKYKDRVFHVQTEDSGVDNPHIITHLFVGGNIIESRKTSYGDIVKNANLTEMLVELMQDQHKTMLKELISGRLDEKLAARSVNAATLNGPAPLNVDAGAQHRASLFVGTPTVDPRANVNKTGTAAPAATKPAAPATPPVLAKPSSAPPAAAAKPPVQPIAVPKPAVPPPPASIFGAPPPPAPAQGAQLDRIIEAETLQRVFDSKNESVVDSIFGEDLISEKSLDEVILSYLAEDMQK